MLLPPVQRRPLSARMAVAGEGRSSEPGQASVPGGTGDTSLLGSATTWPLKRYGRFLPPTDGDDEGQNTSSWKVFESNEESGHLILTIVVSGHFFISQGRTVLVFCSVSFLPHPAPTLMSTYQALIGQVYPEARTAHPKGRGAKMPGVQEGFSLIDSHKWLKIVRRADCLLLCAQSKNECRMFRVQFGGDSKEQMLEHCCSCVQKLAEYVPVQVTDEQSQKLYHSLNQLANGENQAKDTEQNASVLHTPDEPLSDSCTSLGERRSLTQLAQSVLKKKSELPLVYQHSVWCAQELRAFIRLCLMDQNFPAFVEDVEKELKKLVEG